LAAGAATTGSYFWLFGWGKRTATGVDAYLRAPSHGAQVSALIVALGLLAVAVGWFGHPIIGSTAIAAAITSCWALDAALNVRGDRNWPIGMTLVGWASFGGALVLSGSVAELRRVLRQRAEELQAVEQARLEAAERERQRAAEAARHAAERARVLAEDQRRERELERIAALAAARQQADLEPARRAKVVRVFRSSAAKVRASSGRNRAKAS